LRKLSYLFIVLGILLGSFPVMKNLYSYYWQEKLLSEIEVIEIQEDDIEYNYSLLNNILDEKRDVSTEETEDIIEDTKIMNQVIGRIEIPKIKLSLPILEGTSSSNLNKGTGHLTGTNLPGEVGNVVIAAHRGYSYGKLFNRLEELDIGDDIIINYSNKNYQYKVYKTMVVEPADISVLNQNSKDKVLTLITCTPLGEPTHRFIVHAVME